MTRAVRNVVVWFVTRVVVDIDADARRIARAGRALATDDDPIVRFAGGVLCLLAMRLYRLSADIIDLCLQLTFGVSLYGEDRT